jgi:hypothetical protein
MPAYYIGEHVVISGTLEGGRRLNWVNNGSRRLKKSRPKAVLNSNFVMVNQAAINAGFDFRR